MKTPEELARALLDGSRGGFAAQIGEAFTVADSSNRQRLIDAFPEYLVDKPSDAEIKLGRLLNEVLSHSGSLDGIADQLAEVWSGLATTNVFRARELADIRERLKNTHLILLDAYRKAGGK